MAETPVERFLRTKDPVDLGPEVSRGSLQRERSVEAYLSAGGPPRWMERLAEIERGIAREKRELERAHRRLQAQCAGDVTAFARRWHELADRWHFDEELNDLIRRHNEWYPVERRLPMDPRTRDYVLIHGRSYRRPVLNAEWVLETFPAEDIAA